MAVAASPPFTPAFSLVDTLLITQAVIRSVGIVTNEITPIRDPVWGKGPHQDVIGRTAQLPGGTPTG